MWKKSQNNHLLKRGCARARFLQVKLFKRLSCKRSERWWWWCEWIPMTFEDLCCLLGPKRIYVMPANFKYHSIRNFFCKRLQVIHEKPVWWQQRTQQTQKKKWEESETSKKNIFAFCYGSSVLLLLCSLASASPNSWRIPLKRAQKKCFVKHQEKITIFWHFSSLSLADASENIGWRVPNVPRESGDDE